VTTQNKAPMQNPHKKFAVELFNMTWDLMEKQDRSTEEDDRMIHAAHASRFHWGEIGTPLEFERGEWQIPRVYSILERPEPALYHAKRCLDICEANKIDDFDIAFAYKALGRAYAAAQKSDKAREYIELGKEAGEQIKKKLDQEYFLGELNAVAEIIK